MVEEQKQKEEKYDALVEREQEIKEQIQQAREKQTENKEQKPTVPHRTRITELVTGEIIDLEYIDHRYVNELVLTVDIGTQTITVRVNDSKDYSEDNELMRLIKWKNIPEGEFGRLIGKKITLKRYAKRRGDLLFGLFNPMENTYDDYKWKVYVPQSLNTIDRIWFRLDNIARRFGITFIEEQFSGTKHDIIEKLIGIGLISLLYFTSFLVLAVLLTPLTAISGTVAFITWILATIYTATIIKYFNRGYKRYKNYRTKDSLN